MIRYAAYAFFLVNIIQINGIKNKQLIYCFLTFLGGVVISLFTHDIYWAIIVLLILAARNADPRHIVQISYNILLIATIITFSMTMFGLIPMEVNSRSGESVIRYGMGFYHSNVLPLIVFYLMIYRLLIYGVQIKKIEILFWIIVSIIVYNVCKSRNGLYASFLCGVLYILYVILNRYKIAVLYNRFIRVVSRCFLYLCIIFSLLMTAMQGMGLTSIWVINNLFTGRFAIAYHQIKESGIFLISTVPKEDYDLIARALDNGYLFTAIRYGILFLVFYMIIHSNILKKYSFDTIMHIIMICIVATNMVDNDLYSYGFLPIIVLAFSNHTIKYNYKIGNQLQK